MELEGFKELPLLCNCKTRCTDVETKKGNKTRKGTMIKSQCVGMLKSTKSN
jgi:hypothetical protein